jgi:hypothetical protein
MGYHITLSRPKPSPGITAQEWREFVLSRPELKLAEESAHFITAILDGNDNLALHYSQGSASVFTKNPEGPRIIQYLSSIAPHFGGVVTGDEGETYTTAADAGTQSDWDPRLNPCTPPKPWWKRELPRRKRLIAGLLLGVLLVILKELFFPK